MTKSKLVLVFLVACFSSILILPAINTSYTAHKANATLPLHSVTAFPGYGYTLDAVSLELAEQYFDELEHLFNKDGGDLWGEILSAPFVFVDIATRQAVSNTPDPQGILTRQGDLYVGLFPENIFVGNTVVDLGGKRFAMATWCTMEANKNNKTGRLRVMSHEVFHWWQPELIGNIGRWNNSHIQQVDAWISVLLEVNALAQAFNSDGDEQYDAIIDALSIRAARRAQFPGSDVNENRLELLEGLAVYTELKLNFDTNTEINYAVDSWRRFLRTTDSPENHFGYISGALYALLLDKFSAEWKTKLSPGTDLSELLYKAVGKPGLRELNQIDLDMYELADITDAANRQAKSHTETVNAIREAFSGPTLSITSGFGSATLNVCNKTIQAPDMGEVFLGFVEFNGAFGQFSMRSEGYFLLTNENHVVIHADGMEINGNRATGRGWTLVLNEGFRFAGEEPDYSIVRVTG